VGVIDKRVISERRRLRERVAALEADVAELRRHNLRLAELADVMQELLMPMATRDEARLKEAIEQFNRSL
jgi:hypothetical protein